MPFISNGTTILDNGAFSVGLGSQILISEATASASSSIEFTSGIDSTYDIYQFEFININPATDNVDLTFNGSTDSGSNYNVTKTTTLFKAYHDEGDTDTTLVYDTGRDIAQGTGFQTLIQDLGNGADESGSGTLQIFNPSSTTFVKHFISNTNGLYFQNYTFNMYCAGYFNTTSAINAVQFKMESGNFDGTIKMYGIKGS